MPPLLATIAVLYALLLGACGAPTEPPPGPGSPWEPPPGVELVPLGSPEHHPDQPPLQALEGRGLAGTFPMAYSPDDRWLDDFSSGVAALDCDGDGDIDLFFTNQGGPSRLYRNDGNAYFSLDEASGLELEGDHPAGTSVADIDNDGDPDLLVLNHLQPNRMLINDGSCHFVDRAEELGLTDSYRSVHGTWADLNGDGWLDLLVSNWAGARPEVDNQPPPDAHPDRLFLSDGLGSFTDASASLPDDSQTNWGMVTGFFDFEQDGDLDMLQSNDRGNLFVSNRAFRNDGLGKDGAPEWTDVTQLLGLENGVAGMGFALSDVDLDGDLDIFHVADREDLYINEGDGFIESGLAWGLLQADPLNIGWGGTFFDADADGDEDLWYVHSNFFDGPIVDLEGHAGPGRFFRSLATEGGRLLLEELEGRAGEPALWRGQTAVDLDGDGLEDLVHGIAEGEPLILRTNPPEDARVVVVQLRGVQSNAEGRGATIRALVDGTWQTRWPGAVDPVLTGRPAVVSFGLGTAAQIETLEVHWPSGLVQEVTEVPAGFRAIVTEPEGDR